MNLDDITRTRIPTADGRALEPALEPAIEPAIKPAPRMEPHRPFEKEQRPELRRPSQDRDIQRWEDEGGSPAQGRAECPGLRLRDGDRLLIERVHELPMLDGEARYLMEVRRLEGE